MKERYIAVLHEYVNHFNGNIGGHGEGGTKECNYLISAKDRRYKKIYDGRYWGGDGEYSWDVYCVSHIDEIVDVGVYRTSYEIDEWGDPINEVFHLYIRETGAVIPCDKFGTPLSTPICYTDKLRGTFVRNVALVKYKSGSVGLLVKNKRGPKWWGVHIDDCKPWLSAPYDCIFCRKRKVVIFHHHYTTKVCYDPWDSCPTVEIPWYKNI